MKRLYSLLLIVVFILSGCDTGSNITIPDISSNQPSSTSSSVSAYSEPIKEINGGIPEFDSSLKASKESFETYSDLDSLGRCGVCFANIGKDLMPTEERGAIGSVKPSGWKTIKFDIVDGKYLYNRCHLIGYQLTAENANEKNFITGTRYLNVKSMLIYENMVADYIKKTGNHVLYRVTPIFDGNDLVAKAVKMEGYSVEDNGKGICYNILCYNIQPGIEINYSTGDAVLSSEEMQTERPNEAQMYYYINDNTKKFHLESCKYSSSGKRVHKSAKQLINAGYEPCKVCNPAD